MQPNTQGMNGKTPKPTLDPVSWKKKNKGLKANLSASFENTRGMPRAVIG